MSLILNRETKPQRLEIKTHYPAMDTAVFLGDYEISLVDFLAAAEYVLTNTDLKDEKDPRKEFVARLAKATEVEGFNFHNRKLQLDGLATTY